MLLSASVNSISSMPSPVYLREKEGGWVGRWVGGWIEENEAVRMSCCELGEGG